MYIKFCRNYGEDKKEEAKENLAPPLSVELEGEKGKQAEGNVRLYRAGCLFLTVICLVLLMVVIVLSMKLQTGSAECQERAEAPVDRQNPTTPPTCIQPHNLGCQQCARGWHTLGRSCFYLSTYRLSWDESQKNCTARGGSLAVISSPSLQSFLTKKGNLKYWIGLRHNGNEWIWVNNTALQRSYWADTVYSGGCGMQDSVGPPEKNWIRAKCDAYSYFICQVQF